MKLRIHYLEYIPLNLTLLLQLYQANITLRNTIHKGEVFFLISRLDVRSHEIT